MPVTGSPPRTRHVLSSFVERTSYGVQEPSPYNKLFEGRIIFLGTPIDDACANDVMARSGGSRARPRIWRSRPPR
ncbi:MULTISPECIES: hypothetical protein [unclassified Pseudonocardia]|jgi:ATP-dependent Clp protease protease subunit|uniref:hypothetical protein n=1 Tax=unclassified Pseudonocardia TaxID=2619320 RepID=UPI00095F67C4|nr:MULTISPECIES: hypothetical protein [unclassified Pseudonocardia]OJY52537.1 MAG: hypothetical protein BGP03_31950 [Pseudonocardia sp. 73-21]